MTHSQEIEPLARLILIGGGGHALVVAEAAELEGFALEVFLDDNPVGRIAPDADRRPAAPWLGKLEDLAAIRERLEGGSRWIIAVGDLHIRARLLLGMVRRVGSAATVIHPGAFVSPTAEVGIGAYIGPRAVVHTRARIGPHAIINSGAIVEHDCIVGENTHIAPGAVVGGSVVIGSNVLVGLGARVLPNLTIGQGGVVGAGGVVVRPVAPASVVVGVPASEVGGGAAGGVD
jgi:sugar O-acyltransferase (sialic acid O-acetyltransferase NeuD family)